MADKQYHPAAVAMVEAERVWAEASRAWDEAYRAWVRAGQPPLPPGEA